MATKKATRALAQTLAAVVIVVDCPILPRRCRAGYVFEKGNPIRIAVDDISPEKVKEIEADPYLKVNYETPEGEVVDNTDNEQLTAAENRILELENQLGETTKAKEELAAATKRISELEAELTAAKATTTETPVEAATQAKKGK